MGLDLRGVLSGTIALAWTIGGEPAWAQSAEPADAVEENSGGLLEIVVTAERREQLRQVVPAAVTALTGNAPLVNRVLNIRDLDTIAPGLLVSLSSAARRFRPTRCAAASRSAT